MLASVRSPSAFHRARRNYFINRGRGRVNAEVRELERPGGQLQSLLRAKFDAEALPVQCPERLDALGRGLGKEDVAERAGCGHIWTITAKAASSPLKTGTASEPPVAPAQRPVRRDGVSAMLAF